MIIINKCGKFIVPEGESFIGYAGDNLNVTKEIFVEGITDLSLVYRMYLMFDDGSCNYFLLNSEVQEKGTMLVWNITSDQIYKSGVVKVQIKGSNTSGEVFHSSLTTMLVQTAIEFTDCFKNKENSEYLQHQEYLNSLIDKGIQATEEANQALVTAESKIEEYLSMSMDEEPQVGSENPVKSNGLYVALSDKMKFKNSGTITDITAFDSMLDNMTVYNLVVSKNLIEDVFINTSARLVNIGSSQMLTLIDGRTFARTNTDNVWSDFQKTNINYNEFDVFKNQYDLDHSLCYYEISEELTIETLKIYRSSDVVFYFVLAPNQLNNATSQICTMYVNNNYQIVRLIDGSEYIRQFNQKGTTTTWTDFQQTTYSIEQLRNSLAQTGSGTLTAGTEMADSADYAYSKIGNMVTVIINATISTPADASANAQFTGLPYAINNAGNQNRSSNMVVMSQNLNTYSVLCENDVVTLTPVNPTTPTDGDKVTVTLTYLT